MIQIKGHPLRASGQIQKFRHIKGIPIKGYPKVTLLKVTHNYHRAKKITTRYLGVCELRTYFLGHSRWKEPSTWAAL